MKKMLQTVRKAQRAMVGKTKDEKGATMVEYALMLALIAVVCIAAVGAIGTKSTDTFQGVADKINPPAAAGGAGGAG